MMLGRSGSRGAAGSSSGGGGASLAISELQNPEEGWDGTGSQTWIVPIAAGPISSATPEWSGAPSGYAPFHIYESMTVDQVRVTVASATAASTLRVGIYACTTGGWPTSTVVHDFGTIDSSTTGNKTLSGTWALTAGRYWAAVWFSHVTVSINVCQPFFGFHAGVPDSALPADGQIRVAWPRNPTAFHATNPFPTLGAASAQTSGYNGSNMVPYVQLRRSA